MNASKDKIVLDTSDSPELQDYFSRKEAGEKCIGKFEATLDESGDGVATLSISNISFEAFREKKEKAAAKAPKSTAEAVMEAAMEGESAEEENSET